MENYDTLMLKSSIVKDGQLFVLENCHDYTSLSLQSDLQHQKSAFVMETLVVRAVDQNYWPQRLRLGGRNIVGWSLCIIFVMPLPTVDDSPT